MIITDKIDKYLLQEVVNRLLYCDKEYIEELKKLNEKHNHGKQILLGPEIYRKKVA